MTISSIVVGAFTLGIVTFATKKLTKSKTAEWIVFILGSFFLMKYLVL